MTVNTRGDGMLGGPEPNLLLHSVVGAVTAASARIADGMPSLPGDRRAFRRAEVGIRREVEEARFVQSAGSDGRAPVADPAQRVDLAGLLTQAAVAAGHNVADFEAFVTTLQKELAQLAVAAGVPPQEVTPEDRELARRLRALFTHATKLVSGMYGQPSERVLAGLR
jgi:hypothetical protein